MIRLERRLQRQGVADVGDAPAAVDDECGRERLEARHARLPEPGVEGDAGLARRPRRLRQPRDVIRNLRTLGRDEFPDCVERVPRSVPARRADNRHAARIRACKLRELRDVCDARPARRGPELDHVHRARCEEIHGLTVKPRLDLEHRSDVSDSERAIGRDEDEGRGGYTDGDGEPGHERDDPAAHRRPILGKEGDSG